MEMKLQIKIDDPQKLKYVDKLMGELLPHFHGFSTLGFMHFIERYGIEPWIRKARECPKCRSNKWDHLKVVRAEDMMAGANLIALAGFEFLPQLVQYRCRKCKEEFSFWEMSDFFKAPLEGKCPRCGSGRWTKKNEDEFFENYRCKQCDGPVVVDRSGKESKEIS